MLRMMSCLAVLLLLSGCSSLGVYKHETNPYGQNDLMRAVYYQDMELVKEQASNKKVLYETDRTGANIFHYIARYGTSEMASFIISKGTESLLGKKGGINGNTALQEALLTHNAGVAKLLFQSMPDEALEELDSKGRSLLHLAVYAGDEEMVLELLQQGIDPNVQDDAGNTPAHLALYCLQTNACPVDREYLAVFRLLAEYGLDPFLANGKGDTVLGILDKVDFLSFSNRPFDQIGGMLKRYVDINH